MTQKQLTRVFLAHKKDDEDHDIRSWCSTVAQSFEALGDVECIVVAGRDDFDVYQKLSGGWKGWTSRVAAGMRADGTPHYHGCVVPSLRVGRATHEIVEGMLGAGKPVLHLTSDGRLQAIARVELVDRKDWKTGSALVLR